MTQSLDYRGADHPSSIRVQRDVRVPAGEGGTLSADVYLPRHPVATPALVTVVPYRKDLGSEYDASLRWFAAHGYACVLAENAGIGSSDGTPHPPWSPGETDDAVAVVTWTSRQHWCNGSVGMWGISHGGFTAMRVAARHPEPLKAIMPIMNAVDVERDVMHPGRIRGDFTRLALWSGSQLLQQLLPPLVNSTSDHEQARWRRRRDDIAPFFVELAGMAPGDPRWRDRLVELEDIEVPTFCVGGWQDIYPATVLTEAVQRLRSQGKFLVGPWGHTLPQDSPFEPVDFLPIAKRWWDQWLCQIDTGIMDEPPVVVDIRGGRGGWRAYESWPPAHDSITVSTVDTPQLGRFGDDPTIGALSGLHGVGLGAIGLPQDQRDDDGRTLTVTSGPLSRDVLVCGSPTVTVRVAEQAAPPRLVLRVADIDPSGASTAITSGIAAPAGEAPASTVQLAPAAYRVQAGHHIRLIASDADFPRLSPTTPAAAEFVELTVMLPVCPDETGVPIEVPALSVANGGPGSASADWALARSPGSDVADLTVDIGRSTKVEDGHGLDSTVRYHAHVERLDPKAARLTARHRAVATMTTGDEITVDVTIECRSGLARARGRISLNEKTIFAKIWEAPDAEY
jgi:predicted acyl esterase